jgi:hypothetical protein
MPVPRIPIVNTQPLGIDGVVGPVVVTTNSFWGHPTVTVGGQPTQRIGKRQYTLPAVGGGAVEATVRTAFADPYPTLEINGVRHRTGPKVSRGLQALAMLPLIALAAVGGLLGGLLGGLGMVVNLAVIRTRLPGVAKAFVMLGVGVAALTVQLVIEAAVHTAVS